jgi:hypothetical protein
MSEAQLARDPEKPRQLATPSSILIALAVDIVVVVAFASYGRYSHARSLTVSGIAETAWPFLAALLVGWLAFQIWRAPTRVSNGLWVWIVTLAGGMYIRHLAGGGTALAFIIVASCVLAVFLLGWRLIALLLRKALRRSRS